jgi:serine/threonine protein kinase/WD40 repeat protein
MKSCPDRNLLELYVHGQLPTAEFDRVDEHVAACGICEQLLEETVLECDHRHTGPTEKAVALLPDGLLARFAHALANSSDATPSNDSFGCNDKYSCAGRKLGDYRIVREIGRGGMGIVYEAIQQKLGRSVALKVLPHGLFQTQCATTRFQREAAAAAGLHHTNIVPVYEAGEDNGTFYYAMQLIDGDGLDVVRNEIRRSRSGQSVVRSAGDDYYHFVAEIGRQAASALHYAHDRGIVHRDVKPSNLILDQDGIVWLADFGLAKQLDSGLTRSAAAPGTLRYMSPERFQGTVDPSSDIYSLGATLYELLTLEPAFSSEDQLSLLEQIMRVEPRLPQVREPRIPIDLQTIVMKAMAKEPAQRYSNALALQQDLVRFLEGRPILARQITTTERLWRIAKKQKSLAASLVAISLLVVATALAATVAAVYFRKQKIEQSELANANLILAVQKEAESKEAISQRNDAYRNAYLADIRQAQEDWEDGHVSRMLTALRRYVPTVDKQDIRGWEWYYLLSLAHQNMTTISEFEGNVTQVEWSRDGERFFSCGTDETLKIWGLDRRLLRSIDIPGMRQFALNPDDSLAATVSDDEVLRIWDTSTAELVQTIRMPRRQLVSVGWGKIPNLLAVAARPTEEVPGGEVVVIDRFTEFVLQRHDSAAGIATWLNVHPQGDGLAVGGPGIGFTFGFLTQKETVAIGAALFGHVHRATCAAWHPDGQRFAIGFETQGVSVFQIDRNVAQPTLLFQTDELTTADAVTFSTNGMQMFVGNRAQRVDVYDLETKQKRTSFRGHLGNVLSIASHPSGDLVASSSTGGGIKFWQTGKDVDSRESVTNQQDAHGESSDGGWSWQQQGNKVVITATDSGDVLASLLPFNGDDANTSMPAKAKIFPQADCALFWPTAGVGGPRRVWVCDTTDWKKIQPIEPTNYEVPWADFRADFALVAQGGALRLFDGRTGTLHTIVVTQGSPPGLSDRLEPLVGKLVAMFSPSGDRFVTCAGAEVKIWDTEKRIELATFVAHRPNAFVSRLGWSNLGRLFATGATDQTIVLWDALQLRQIQTLRGLQDTPDINVFGFNSDDSRFMAADSQHLKVWDVKTGREILSIPRGPLSESVYTQFTENDSAADFNLTESELRFESLSKAETIRADRVGIDRFSHETLLGLARFLVFNTHADPAERAVTLSRQALKLRPTDADTLFVNGMALYRAGEFAESPRVLKLASDSGMSDTYAVDILRSLLLLKTGTANDMAAAATVAYNALQSADVVDSEHWKLISEFAHSFGRSMKSTGVKTRIVVNTLQDSLDEDPSMTSLREALLFAPNHSQIEFKVSGTIELKLGPLEIERSLEIIGPGSKLLTISGGNRTRLLLIDDRNPAEVSSVSLSGMRFTGGASNSKSDARTLDSRDGPNGSLYSRESLSVIDCLLDNNHLQHGSGGAIYAEQNSILKLIRTSFESNSAPSGGAVYIGLTSDVSIGSCTFEQNEQLTGDAKAGGAITNYGMLKIANSTFSQNRSLSGGAIGLFANGNQVEIEHCTFFQNTGGAISTHESSKPLLDQHVTLSNCILSGNTDSYGLPHDLLVENSVQAIVSHSFIGVDQGGYVNGGGNVIGLNPFLGPLADNGGPTKTHAILAGSPAIDAGDKSGTQPPLEFDQRGAPFRRIISGPDDSTPQSDMGAFELQD